MNKEEILKYKKGRRFNVGIESYLLKTQIKLTGVSFCKKKIKKNTFFS